MTINFIKLMLLVLSIFHFSWSHQAYSTEFSLATIPDNIFGLARELDKNDRFIEDLKRRNDNDLDIRSKEYLRLYDLFYDKKEITYLHSSFYYPLEHCKLKNETGFSCGAKHPDEARKNGFLFISDPIENKMSFILMIVSGLSPSRTRIVKIFEDNLEIIYSENIDANICKFIDSGAYDYGLGVTYNIKYLGAAKYELREEINNYTSYDARVIEMDLSSGGCTLRTSENIEVRPFGVESKDK